MTQRRAVSLRQLSFSSFLLTYLLSNCPLARAVDGHIMRCGTIGSCQFSCHFRYFKALLVTSLTLVSGAIASVQIFTFPFISLHAVLALGTHAHRKRRRYYIDDESSRELMWCAAVWRSSPTRGFTSTSATVSIVSAALKSSARCTPVNVSFCDNV